MKKSIGEQIAQLPAEQQALVPEIKVEIEPSFELNLPPIDMGPMTAAIERLMLKPAEVPNVNVQLMEKEEERKPKKIRIDVERDSRGFIKSLICTEIENV